ncbi:MAG TPA: thiol peroxidase, partial [candidate division Zixibacteria bacterium]|nr:thiol peroxidase [candidate division Zixibacteria bacterium]
TAQRTVQTGGGPLPLAGRELKPGDPAPMNATLIRTDMTPAPLTEHRGVPRLYSVTPSLDTSVCNKQTVMFNRKLAEIGGEFQAFAISVDLPAAQKRFVEEYKVDRLTPLSDYRHVAFGEQFGVLIPDIRLLARSVFVVDRHDRVTYVQVTEAVGTEPDYDRAIAALKEAMKR